MTHVTSRMTAKNGISSGSLRLVIEYRLPIPYLNLMSLSHVYVYISYELFFIRNVVRLLSCVNMCVCHVYFTIELLKLT